MRLGGAGARRVHPITGGSHGKLHRTTKILSHARRRGGGMAARGTRAAIGDAGDRRYQWLRAACNRGFLSGLFGRKIMEWFNQKTSIAGIQVSNWMIALGALIVLLLAYSFM